MDVHEFISALNADFFTGVPDSQLKALCDYLMHTYGIDPQHHIVAANEGNCVALAAGYHLATGRVPVVYMQNSGEGNVINPVASLLNEKVYAIPLIFIIGWRGEPGVHDEPQHLYQGEVTLKLLEEMDIAYFVIGKETAKEDLFTCMERFHALLTEGKQVSFVVKRDALSFSGKVVYRNGNTMMREEVIRHIVAATGDDIIVSTTGKVSRELFEIREVNGQSHRTDFLAVGSMGHSSSIALGIALQRSDKRVWAIDGDGAALMHLGAMAVIGANAPRNMVHIVINNEAHETVGGVPTVAKTIDLVKIAQGCGYPNALWVSSFEALDKALRDGKERATLSFIEVKCAVGARPDLGRPTQTPQENKRAFMENMQENGHESWL